MCRPRQDVIISITIIITIIIIIIIIIIIASIVIIHVGSYIITMISSR